MKTQTTKKAIRSTWDIADVLHEVSAACGCAVYFDDSRAWSIYTEEKPAAETTPGFARKYGAYRDYLGGGVRGSICTNLTGDLGEIFTEALKQIEDIYNEETAGGETWEQATGVLLN